MFSSKRASSRVWALTAASHTKARRSYLPARRSSQSKSRCFASSLPPGSGVTGEPGEEANGHNEEERHEESAKPHGVMLPDLRWSCPTVRRGGNAAGTREVRPAIEDSQEDPFGSVAIENPDTLAGLTARQVAPLRGGPPRYAGASALALHEEGGVTSDEQGRLTLGPQSNASGLPPTEEVKRRRVIQRATLSSTPWGERDRCGYPNSRRSWAHALPESERRFVVRDISFALAVSTASRSRLR